MRKLILSSAEKMMDCYLHADPEIACRLNALSGKSILIELLDLRFSFLLSITGKKILISDVILAIPTVKIKGNSFSLLRLLLHRGPVNAVLSDSGIEMEGDVFFLQTLRDIFMAIEVDWNDILSPYLGEFFSSQANRAFKRARTIFDRNKALFKKNVTLYMQEEIKLFPSQEEIRDWYEEIASLRDDVERAEARLNHLIACR